MATMFRTWVLPSLLNNLGQSMHDKLPIRLFELDLTFGVKDSAWEHYSLCGVACDAQVNFNDIEATFEGPYEKASNRVQNREGDSRQLHRRAGAQKSFRERSASGSWGRSIPRCSAISESGACDSPRGRPLRNGPVQGGLKPLDACSLTCLRVVLARQT